MIAAFRVGAAWITGLAPQTASEKPVIRSAGHAAIYNSFSNQQHLISRPTLRRFRAEADPDWESPLPDQGKGRLFDLTQLT